MEKTRPFLKQHSGSVPMVEKEASIEKEALIEKLQSVPEEVLRNILTNQVDLEIRLKHKELKLTEEEIGKCEAQMLVLRKFFEVPNEISFRSEPNDFTLKYFDILNKSLSVNYTKLQQLQYAQQNPVFKESIFGESEMATHSYRTRSTTSSLRPSLVGAAVRIPGCLYRRTDGIIVKLTCPDCGRSNFSSAQGFLNHNRIAHSREYASQDAAAAHCGEILPDEFQDEVGLASLKLLNSQSNTCDTTQVQKNYFGSRSSLGLDYGSLEPNTGARKPSSGRSTPEVGKKSGTYDVDAKALSRDSADEGAGSKELMKKLISKGIARDAKDFDKLIDEIQREVPNAHLFPDEEETVEAEKPCETISVPGPSKEQAKGNVKTSKSVAGEKQPPESLCVSSSTAVTDNKASHPPVHPESGGKYENRLRRRKSRADMTLDNSDLIQDDGDRRTKRKKAHR